MIHPITLVLPTHERAAILAQTFGEYLALPVAQIVVIDDASGDDSAHVVEAVRDSRVVYRRLPRRHRQPACRNIGVEIAAHPYVLMGEDDVFMPPEYVHHLWCQIHQLDADIVAGRLIAMQRGEDRDAALARSDAEPHPHFVVADILGGDFGAFYDQPLATPFLHACALLKRDWAVRHPYCEEYRGNALREETDFYLRCHADGARLFFCSDAVAYHMFHDYSGGCRSNPVSYAWSGVVNNHRFAVRHWPLICRLLGWREARWQWELRFGWRFVRMTLLFWLAARLPRLHAALKRFLHPE